MSTEKWSMVTMATINRMTPDIKGKGFDPDWFLLRERFEAIETENEQLASEVERLTMELNAATLGEATKQDVTLDKMSAALIAAEKYIEGVNADWPKGMDSDRDELLERIRSAQPDENPDENYTA